MSKRVHNRLENFPAMARCWAPLLRHCCQHRLLPFGPLFRTRIVCKQWDRVVSQALRLPPSVAKSSYAGMTLDDIHAADKQWGLLEFFYTTRPTRAEVSRLGGAAFSVFRRIFQFSEEEFLSVAVGRAAHVPGFANVSRKCLGGMHGSSLDDGTGYVDGGESWEAILRDCHCHMCYYCLSECVMWGGDPFSTMCKCGKMTSFVPDKNLGIDLTEVIMGNLNWRYNNRDKLCVTSL